MKHIKVRILATIWVSIFLLFVPFYIILNLTLPVHFEKEAKAALTYEMEYMSSMQKQESEDAPALDYVGIFFSGDICFIDLTQDPAENSAADNSYGKYNVQSAEHDVLSYYDSQGLPFGQIRTLKTDNGYYVMVLYEDVFSWDGEKVPTIMYLNIQPIVQYTKRLNWLLDAIFLCVAAIMSVIGFRLGGQIEESQENQRRFFQNSSHELKTPLMAIQGYAEGIQTGVVDPIHSAEVIMQESDRLTRMVEEILYISKIDVHQLVLHIAVLDVREMLYDCLRSAEPIQNKKQCSVVTDFPDAPVRVRCDEDQLTRSFMNVLINGMRHCDKTVWLSCKADRHIITITIRDDGGGMDPQDLPHVFDRFYSGKKGNTGIGLALASDIIRLHKGSITAHNDKSGAVFEIRLPVAP